ncbi:MAG: ATP-grasp domain-containing protein, partial [Planctomycetes bacterium]|nr:ATP-grasp domain-containing protein [Planctomycetota bacterium]
MDMGTTRALRGPNIWSQSTVLETIIDLSQFSELSISEKEQIRFRVGKVLPNVVNPLPDDGPETMSRRVGLSLAELLVRIALDLQTQAGSIVTLARAMEMKDAGHFRCVVQYREEPVGRLAWIFAGDVLQAMIDDQPSDVRVKIEELRNLDQQIRLGPSTGSIVRAAMARGIPARRLNDRSLVQLGYGCHQHRILAAETDMTSAVAESIVQDKELTKNLLSAIGVPVPKGRSVSSADDAWEAAQEIGLPVVIKPKDGNQGRGVAVNLNSREQVLAAYAAAKEEGSVILCEKFA